MKDRHIIEILDAARFAELGTDELKTVQNHCAECSNCRQAFDAAQISAVLLNVQASRETVQPSAFFQTKVLNALREKQAIRKPLAAFGRWWQAAYPLVCSMLLIVITLGALTFLAPKSNADEAVSTYNLYSTDAVILNQKPSPNLTTGQTLEVIYSERRDGTKK